MQTRELFKKDPTSWSLANEGVSSNNSHDETTLRYELETFVCDGEYQAAMEKILRNYIANYGKEQPGAWVSGFYGSGKSHLVKVLRYLWTNHEFSDGSRARELAKLPSDVSDLLVELTGLGARGEGLHSAGGTLKAGSGDVRSRILQIIFQSVDLPEKLNHARLIMDLKEDGTLDAIRAAVEASGKTFENELAKIYTSKDFQEAYLASHPHHESSANVAKNFREQYPSKGNELTIDETMGLIRRAISPDSPEKLPCSLIVLDEVQQYINDRAEIANDIQEIVEAVQSMLDGRVIIAATGQSALTDTPSLQRIMGRFPRQLRTHLKDNDVEKVVRTVVLHKKSEHKDTIQKLVTTNAGEISRQLNSTKIASTPADDEAYVPDFPLLPVRRRFWRQVLQHTDSTGTTAQMRTQLSVTHNACRLVADQEVGAIIPGDFLYDQLASDLLSSGELAKRFHEIIEEQKTKPQGILRSRICSLIFLINKLPETDGDLGIRANAEHLCDLLTDHLTEGIDELRQAVPLLLKNLHEEAVLMENEGCYQLQTTEGAAWEGEFRKKFASIKNDESLISTTRQRLLSDEVQKLLSSISVTQGDAKVSRKSQLHQGRDQPTPHDGPSIWVRNGFSEAESAILDEIKRTSTDDATVFVFIAENFREDFKAALAATLAAEETLSNKGNPNTEEGKTARQAMESRLRLAESKVSELMAKLLSEAKVYLAGGEEQPFDGLREGVSDACGQVVDRLFPKFHIGDSGKWPSVWKRAKDGNANAFEALGYQGDLDKHPVAAEILRFVAGGKKGTEIVSHFTSGVYGWPKDAVDATLGALLASSHLAGKIDSNLVALSNLSQRDLGKVKFRAEHPVLSAVQKLQIRKLFQAINHPFKPNEEQIAATLFLPKLRELAASTGGPAPLPEAPAPPFLTELETLSGNDLLHRLFVEKDSLTTHIKSWQATAKSCAQRKPDFALAESLYQQAVAGQLAEATQARADLDAVIASRNLLDDPCPVAPILKDLGSVLRQKVRAAHKAYESAIESEHLRLEGNTTWIGCDPGQRESLLQGQSVRSQEEPIIGSEAELLRALQICDLPRWDTLKAALPQQFDQALTQAIKLSEPKARRLTIPSATIKTPEDLEAWLTARRKEITEALKDGPVIL
jgi:hypothetical protein